MNGYYDCLPHFSKIMAEKEPAMRMNCKTQEEFEAWREKAEISLYSTQMSLWRSSAQWIFPL
jgi:hypothetical protein